MGESMFVGEYYPVLDEKYRLVLPVKFRAELGTTFYALIDFDHCISLYSEKDFLLRAERIKSLDEFSSDSRKLKRLFFGNSFEVTLDKVGRILIPKPFLEKAKIEKELALVGVYDHLELWDLKTFKKKSEEEEADYEVLAEKIAKRD